MSGRPILYSFRRCPYAMRARMAIAVAQVRCDLREVVLRDKPQHMLEISPKGTVPVILEPDGRVIEESLEIMHWALGQSDPENWLAPETGSLEQMMALIAECDGPFKHALDRYKYPDRYEDINAKDQRALGLKFLQTLDHRLGKAAYLFGPRESLADNAIFPFIRQFANTDRAWFDALVLSNLQLWLSHFLESQRFQSIMRKYPQWKSGEAEPIFPPQN